ncbi:gamma-glutamylcyclotransferase [Seonamhaeicola algicola]|uniref:Gamma-glutamylcyclotransferase n=2 Tax=Seonamhaeicola TaxID=1649495 RepID=A0A5C7B554_9FLAO|nr:gamma-glutamylcyclotransferase family protein [Seonamhaeicola algicola]TXE15033.1 gamma-glutamylcyclotransferase [Seonamhaeicola algicola]
MTAHYLFVYGTLLQNAENEMSAFLKAHATVISKGYFIGQLYKISWFPGAILSNDQTQKVYGTLVKLTKNVFEVLDDYEDFKPNNPSKSLFIRQKVTVFAKNNRVYNAWVYLYNQNVNPQNRIVSGDFLKDA